MGTEELGWKLLAYPLRQHAEGSYLLAVVVLLAFFAGAFFCWVCFGG